MKEIKEKSAERAPKSNSTGKIPKAALKKAWTEAKEKSRTKLRESTSTQENGDYTTANGTSGMLADTSYSAIKKNTDFTVQQGRKLARKQIEKYRERRTAEQGKTTRAYTASERGVSPKQTGHGTLPDAAQRPRRGADLPRQRAKEKAVTAKTAPRDIRGVTQGQRQLRTAGNETVRSVTTQAQMHTRIRQVQLAIQKAASNTRRTVTAVRSAIRHFLASLHRLVAAIAVGISVALSIIIVISLVAFVSGSAYGIFFAADAPNAASVTVREAVETLTEEYRDRLEEISDTVQHDRQDITANDDVYHIRWQDVLAVFSSYVSGNEQGTPVAALTAEQVDKLRETMWAMNAVDYSTHPETTTIDTTDEDGNPTTTEITETVLVIELTHKTPDEMAADYHFTTRQNTYLQLLQDPQYEELWADLLGGFASGGGKLMNPDSTRTPTGTLQWPLPVAGTITSQFGHRVDPITGEVSSHTGTDIACAEGTPILAAADGTVTVANGLDSWGGSYGFYIQIDHDGGLETLYAHCSSICVTTGQQVQAGEVIGYVGHTGRVTGNHLHLEVRVDGNRADAMQRYEKIIAYVNNPEQLSETADLIGNTLGEGIGISTQDTMYQKMKFSIMQIERVTKLVFGLTVMTSIFVVGMLLCMWMRNRKVEIAVFISLGIPKLEVFLQMMTEIVCIYSLSCMMSAGVFRVIIPFLSELMGGMDGVRMNLVFSMWNVWKVWGIGVIILILITFIVMLPCLTKKIKDTLSEMEG